TKGLETVWVKDMTAETKGYKRELEDYDLPDQLTFNLRRGLEDLTLKLKRNYEIDPNAVIYVVQKIKNGRSIVAKTNDLETEVKFKVRKGYFVVYFVFFLEERYNCLEKMVFSISRG
ncbi:hypothetical protein ACJMK2_004380, partial [Sinanodonta woodiana]